MFRHENAIYGNNCSVYHEGEWVTNAKGAEYTVEIGKEEIQISGDIWVGHKQTSLTGTGTLQTYKYTSKLVKLIGSIAQPGGKPYVTELIMKVADPTIVGAERVRLKNVQFDRIPLGKFEVGSIVEEELPFTFRGFDLLDEIPEQ